MKWLYYVMWPDGCPSEARTLRKGQWFVDWCLAFSWSMRGKRTCRVWNTQPNASPFLEAQRCQRIMDRSFK